jgi:D-sedoheptulose 7-phosphate isomerase
MRAVFLDRDGVLNHVVPRDGLAGSPRELAELTLVPGAGEAVGRLRAAGFLTLVVTNQPDLARGLLLPDVHDAIMERVRGAVGPDDMAACPHDDADRCACRKPLPGMLTGLAARWGVSLEQSYVVGDGWKDMEAARAAGCRTILVRNDWNHDVVADAVATDLAGAVDLILGAAAEATSGSHAMTEPTRGPMNGDTYAGRYLAEVREVASALDPAEIEAMATALAALRDRGGRLFCVGVGGGAANASHATTDFRKIAGIEAYCPLDNVAELTARINDDGWDGALAAYLRASRLGPHDGLFIFSVGGGDADRGISGNLVSAMVLAAEVGATVFGVVGRDGGHTARQGQHVVVVPTVNGDTITPHTESFQAVVWHLLVSHPNLQRHGMKWESVAAGAGAS